MPEPAMLWLPPACQVGCGCGDPFLTWLQVPKGGRGAFLFLGVLLLSLTDDWLGEDVCRDTRPERTSAHREPFLLSGHPGESHSIWGPSPRASGDPHPGAEARPALRRGGWPGRPLPGMSAQLTPLLCGTEWGKRSWGGLGCPRGGQSRQSPQGTSMCACKQAWAHMCKALQPLRLAAKAQHHLPAPAGDSTKAPPAPRERRLTSLSLPHPLHPWVRDKPCPTAP